MSVSFRNLLDIGLNVDLSGLENVLSGMRDRLDGLQDRIADLEKDGASGLDESEVRDIAQEAVDGAAILDENDVERIVANQGYLTSSNAYDAVSDQVYDMVKDVVREDLDEKDFADRDHDHDYATTDSVEEVEGRVSTLESTVDAFADHEGRIEALEQRLGVYANKADSAALNLGEWRAEDLAALGQRIEALEAQQASYIAKLDARIEGLEESSSASTRFFKLAVQMLDIVRESVGR